MPRLELAPFGLLGGADLLRQGAASAEAAAAGRVDWGGYIAF